MIYYKHKKTGEVYAYETEEDRKEYGSSDLVKMTQSEVNTHLNPVPTVEQLASQVRYKRDLLLQESDWTQVPDSPVDKESWATYRQALRDITEQEGFPRNVTWPEEP